MATSEIYIRAAYAYRWTRPGAQFAAWWRTTMSLPRTTFHVHRDAQA